MKSSDIKGLLKGFWVNITNKGAEKEKGTYRDTMTPVRLGFLVLVIGFGGFLLWAAFAPLDEGVPCQGNVRIATESKVIEHLYGGTVAAVEVREGEMVHEGQILLVLDSMQVKARYDEAHNRYLGLRATESRLLAEMHGDRLITFHEDLLNDPDSTLAKTYMEGQRKLFRSRHITFRILNEQLQGIRDLVNEGYVPLSQQHDIELRLAEFISSSFSQLAQVQIEVGADAEKSLALRQELEDTVIRAPVDGQVVDLQVQTAGSVIRPGEKIMDIVPLREELLIDAKVPPQLIDSIHDGLPVDVSFFAFAHSPNLIAEGEVVSVSMDIVTDPKLNPMQPGATYYLARIALTPKGLKTLGKRQMQPGMPVQVVIKTGERSLLTYLLNPLYKRITVSMKEE